jgi:quinol monooxygenase YgiN
MSLPALIGFAGVLVAAVATGVLAGRCVRQPRIGFILWTAATLGLTAALAAQSTGFASGFNATTFRAVQLFALLLAPLWLAWGLVELIAGNAAVRFGARLMASALTVVAVVILVTDPLSAVPFGKSWPSAGPHFQPVAYYALDAVQVVAVAAALVSAGLSAARARQDPRWRPALFGVGAVCLAVLLTVALRLSWPDRSVYPLLSLMAAALVWFGATRTERLAVGGPPDGGSGIGSGIGSGAGDSYQADRARSLVDDYGGGAAGVRGVRGAAGVPGGQYATYGYQGPRAPGRPPRPGGPQGAGGFPGPGSAGRPADRADPGRADPGRADPGRRAGTGPMARPPERPGGRQDRYGGPGTGPYPANGGRQAVPDSRPAQPPGPEAAVMAGEDTEFGTSTKVAGSPAAARPYGRILIFTLLDDRAADFDRLAEQTAEEVRIGEPDTLVYVIHLVPNAPLQRIFYEIYRDRAAFDRHESQPYMKRFVADRRSCVLATNVIELTLKYAKVAPLPTPQPSGTVLPPGARAQLPPGPPQGTQRLQPPPFAPTQPSARTPRPDQTPRPGPAPRPGRPGQSPSAARRYGGT